MTETIVWWCLCVSVQGVCVYVGYRKGANRDILMNGTFVFSIGNQQRQYMRFPYGMLLTQKEKLPFFSSFPPLSFPSAPFSTINTEQKFLKGKMKTEWNILPFADLSSCFVCLTLVCFNHRNEQTWVFLADENWDRVGLMQSFRREFGGQFFFTAFDWRSPRLSGLYRLKSSHRNYPLAFSWCCRVDGCF